MCPLDREGKGAVSAWDVEADCFHECLGEGDARLLLPSDESGCPRALGSLATGCLDSRDAIPDLGVKPLHMTR